MRDPDGRPAAIRWWVESSHPDPARAASFYARVFGWEIENRMPAGAAGHSFVASRGGLDVAAIGPAPQRAGATAAWSTHIWVGSADETAARARAAGGGVLVEPFDVPGTGRRAVLADPSGAAFGVCQATRRRGAASVGAPGSASGIWSDLYTRDPLGARAFYGAVFGWQTEAMDGWIVPMTDDGFPREARAHWNVTFSVADVDAVANRAWQRGAAVVVPPYDVARERAAVLRDPQGALLSISTGESRRARARALVAAAA